MYSDIEEAHLVDGRAVGRIGIGLLVGCGGLVVLGAIIAVRGGAIGLGGADTSGGLALAIVVTLGSGLLLVGVAGQGRVRRVGVRRGIVIAGSGLLLASIPQVSIVIDPSQPDQLGNGLWVLLGLVGWLSFVVGLLVAGISVAVSGSPRS